MTNDDPQIKLRLPAEMRDCLAERAKHNKRSLNGEIVALLEEVLTFYQRSEAASERLRRLTEQAQLLHDEVKEQLAATKIQTINRE